MAPFARIAAPPADPAERPVRPRPALPDPIEAVLGRQLLEAHLAERHQKMEADPSDLEGLEPPCVALMIRAMAAAAHADGRIDPVEAVRLQRALRDFVPDEQARERLAEEIAEPPSLELLVRQIEDEKTAARFYAASVRALRRGAATNRAYLTYLAQRLRLPRDLVIRINRRFDVPLYVS